MNTRLRNFRRLLKYAVREYSHLLTRQLFQEQISSLGRISRAAFQGGFLERISRTDFQDGFLGQISRTDFPGQISKTETSHECNKVNRQICVLLLLQYHCSHYSIVSSHPIPFHPIHHLIPPIAPHHESIQRGHSLPSPSPFPFFPSSMLIACTTYIHTYMYEQRTAKLTKREPVPKNRYPKRITKY